MIDGGYSEYYPNTWSIKDSVHILNTIIAEDKRIIDGPRMIFGEASQPIQHPHSDPIVLTIKIITNNKHLTITNKHLKIIFIKLIS